MALVTGADGTFGNIVEKGHGNNRVHKKLLQFTFISVTRLEITRRSSPTPVTTLPEDPHTRVNIV